MPLNPIEQVLADAGEYVDECLENQPDAKDMARQLLHQGQQPWGVTVSRYLHDALIFVQIQHKQT